MIKAAVIALLPILSLSESALSRVPTPGERALGMLVNTSNDWEVTVNPNGEMAYLLTTGDKILGWKLPGEYGFELRFSNTLADFSDFVCDNIGSKAKFFMEDVNTNKGVTVRVDLNDPNGHCP